MASSLRRDIMSEIIPNEPDWLKWPPTSAPRPNFEELGLVRKEMNDALRLFHDHVKYVVYILISILAAPLLLMRIVPGFEDKPGWRLIIACFLIALPLVIGMGSLKIIEKYYQVYIAAMLYAVKVHIRAGQKNTHPWLLRTVKQAEDLDTKGKVQNSLDFLKVRAASRKDSCLWYKCIIIAIVLTSVICGISIFLGHACKQVADASGGVKVDDKTVASSIGDFKLWIGTAIMSGVALGAAYIGACATRKATREAVQQDHRNELARQTQTKQDHLKAFYQAIEAEVNTCWQGHMVGPGKQLEAAPEDEPWLMQTLAVVESFPVYESQVAMLGQIADVELRNLLIRTYAGWSVLLRLLQRHGRDVAEFGELYWKYEQARTPDKASFKTEISAKKKFLCDTTIALKGLHNSQKESVTKLLEALKDELKDGGESPMESAEDTTRA
jgi:hypothetical protein